MTLPTPDELAAIEWRALPETLVEQASQFYDLIASDDGIVEIRVPKHLEGYKKVASGYARSTDEFLRMVAQYQTDPIKARGVYATINPVDPALYALSPGGFTQPAETTTSDGNIVRRRLLYIDVDSKRPSTYISATEEEREAALRTTANIAHYLTDTFGFPDPAMIGSSGNGGALYYRIDLPNDADSLALIERALAHLADAFPSVAVTVDSTVANASRIAKIPGTASAKGYATEDRPWRYAIGIFTPNPETVTHDQLAAVAAQAPKPEEPTKKTSDSKSKSKTEEPRAESTSTKTGEQGTSAARLEAALKERGIGFTVKDAGYALTYQLDRCLTSSDHTDGAVLQVMKSGALVYRCLHNTCSGKGWSDVREQLGFGRGRTDQQQTTREDRPLIRRSELRNRPRASFLIPDLVPANGLVLLSGDPGTGKTFLAIQLAHGIATESRVFGRAAKRGGVVYIAAEGDYDIDERLSALESHSGKTTDDDRFGILDYDADLINETDDVIAKVKSLPVAPALIVVDTLARTMTGDENSAQDMGEYVKACDRIRVETGASVIIVHHRNKSGTYRGSTALLGAVNTHLEVETTANDGVVLRCGKQKSAKAFDPIHLKKTPIALSEPDSIFDVEIGKVSTLSSFVFEVDVSHNETGGLSQIERDALQTLADADDWLTVSDWRALGELSQSTMQRIRPRFKRDGLIEIKTSGKSTLNRITETGRLLLDPAPKATVSKDPFGKRKAA